LNMKTTITERTINSLLIIIIRILVFTSAAIVLTGGALYLCKYGLSKHHYSTFHDGESILISPIAILHGALNFYPKAIIQLGLLLLMAIPLIRVILFLLLFLFQRDWLYCGITMFVLCVLLYSLIGGM
jgi:uncharacterized membrane protein